MADVDDYLEEGWDPRAVTMPRLRSILVTHNVDYPSTAKKAQLVELVTDNVLSQAPKLRAQKLRAKRSSMGIVNAGSAEDDGIWDDSELAPPASIRRSKTPRKSSGRSIKKEEDDAPPVLRSPAKRTSRSVSRALSHADEDEPPRSVRQSRRTITPIIKDESEEEESEDDTEVPENGDESVFTDDNPFQSGSSPLQNTPPRWKQDAVTASARSAKSRRQTDGYTYRARTPKTFDLSEPTTRHESPDIDAGEEFTPDAQLELEDAARKGEVTLVPRKTRTAPRRGFGTPLAVLFTALLGAYGTWYRSEKINVGYCGYGKPAQEILPDEVKDYVPDALVPFIEAQCEPCPQHAFCYEDYSVRCETDFLLQPHPLSFGGLVPLPPTCEPDGEKARRVQSVADKAVEELREIRAKFECGELTGEDGSKKDTPTINEDELKATVSKQRSKRLNSDEFEELWASAIGEVTAREEIEVETP